MIMCCLVTAAVPDESGALWNNWQRKTKKFWGGKKKSWNATPSTTNLTWSHLGLNMWLRSEKPVTGQNVENHHFPSLFFIRFYDFYSLSASLSSIHLRFVTITHQGSKHFARNISDGTSRNLTQGTSCEFCVISGRAILAAIVCWK
jgi:hypothetical protein